MRGNRRETGKTAALDLGVPAALILIAALAGAMGSPAFQRTMTSILINVVIVIGLYVFIGNSGVLSFGHVSFVAIGAYAGALLTMPAFRKEALLPDLPGFLSDVELAILPGALLAGAVAGFVALALATPLMRTSTVAIPVSTVALLVITQVVIEGWDAVTRGNSGLAGIPSSFGVWTGAAFAIGLAACAYAYQRSVAGLKVRATREDEIAAEAVGISSFRERTIAFVVSAAIAGVGGALAAQNIGAITPATFYFTFTFTTLAFLIVGGARSLLGAVTGTLFVSAGLEVLKGIEDGATIGPVRIAERPGLATIGLALILLVVLIKRPAGITGGLEASEIVSAVRVGRGQIPEGDFRWRSRQAVRRHG